MLTRSYFQLYDTVVESEDISDEQKARICKKFAEADKVKMLVLMFLTFTCLPHEFYACLPSHSITLV